MSGTMPLAHVRAVPSPESSLEAPTREVVTLYGTPTAESLALALAATLESRKAADGRGLAERDLRITEGEGAVGDVKWYDRDAGAVIRRELAIPLHVLRETAAELLKEGGHGIRRLLAGLLMPDWPEGTRRALTYQLVTLGVTRSSSGGFLASFREADAENFADDE